MASESSDLKCCVFQRGMDMMFSKATACVVWRQARSGLPSRISCWSRSRFFARGRDIHGLRSAKTHWFVSRWASYIIGRFVACTIRLCCVDIDSHGNSHLHNPHVGAFTQTWDHQQFCQVHMAAPAVSLHFSSDCQRTASPWYNGHGGNSQEILRRGIIRGGNGLWQRTQC